MATVKFTNTNVRETAAKFRSASQRLPDNFAQVVQVFKRYAEKSNSNDLLNRANEIQEIQDKKIIVTAEIMGEIAKAMDDAADKNEEMD